MSCKIIPKSCNISSKFLFSSPYEIMKPFDLGITFLQNLSALNVHLQFKLNKNVYYNDLAKNFIILRLQLKILSTSKWKYVKWTGQLHCSCPLFSKLGVICCHIIPLHYHEDRKNGCSEVLHFNIDTFSDDT